MCVCVCVWCVCVCLCLYLCIKNEEHENQLRKYADEKKKHILRLFKTLFTELRRDCRV